MRPSSKRLLAALVTLALAFVLAGCAQQTASGGTDGKPTEEGPPKQEQAAEEPRQPEYKSWVVNIVDEDSYSEGGMTYKIAVNINATNPTPYADGTYDGKATASTTQQGTVNGLALDAQAISQSGTLDFTLKDPKGDDLAPLTPDGLKLSGTGSITMKSSGHVSVGPAGGSYGNTSGQKLDVQVDGAKVTLKVNIENHTYTFHGTISGNE